MHPSNHWRAAEKPSIYRIFFCGRHDSILGLELLNVKPWGRCWTIRKDRLSADRIVMNHCVTLDM